MSTVYCIHNSMNINNHSCYVDVHLSEYNISIRIHIHRFLTEKERALLKLLAQGKSITDIARYRCRCVKTVSAQKIKLYEKLHIRNGLVFWVDMFMSPLTNIEPLSDDGRLNMMKDIFLKQRNYS